MYSRTLAAALLVVALFGAACGDDDDGGTSVVGEAPKAGDPSPLFGLPLPEDAVAEAASAPAGGEAYRIPGASLNDVNAFYATEADNKPLKGREWCGAAVYGADHIVRVWQTAPAGQVVVHLTTAYEGVLVAVIEDPAAAAGPCPPVAPPGDQPFEGPGV